MAFEVNLSAGAIESATDLDVKGRILYPCIAPLAVNGKPARVRFSREVINAAYAKLKAKLARGGGVEMRLVHPDLNPLSIPYGRTNGFRHDPTTGSVYLAGSMPLPEMESLFDAQAREALLKMGLSMRAPARLEPCTDGEADYDAVEMGELIAVDIVDRGAFVGSEIVQHLPAGLTARISSAHAKGAFTVTGQRAGNIAQAPGTGESQPMPKIESVEQVPDEVRAMVPEDQLPAYITAYNAMITAGLDPQAAHEAALKAVTNPAGQEQSMKPEDVKTIEARLAAASADKARLEQEKTDLVAQLSAMKGENTTLDARLKLVEADLSAAKAEKADRDAQDDVDSVIRGGVAPAMREGLLAARKSMGKEGFAKLAATIPKTVPVGEMGRTGEHAGASPVDVAEKERAERLYTRAAGNVDQILAERLHESNPAMMGLLAARHADHPKIKRLTAKPAGGA